MGGRQQRMPPWQAWLLAVLVVAGAFVVFPFGCDGEYVLFDPVWYASGSDQYTADVVKSHHMLFHLAVSGIAGLAGMAGLEDPGHVATRTLSGLGAAVILLTLVTLAGRGRWRIGAGLFLLLLATRAFFLEAFLGENVLPATAAALLALLAALRREASLRTVGLLTVHALLWRQDAILVLPAILLALWWRLPVERRVPRLVTWTALCGVATLALYLVVGLTLDPGNQLAGVDGGFDRLKAWMWGIAKDDYNVARNPLAAHAVSFGESITGQQFPPFEIELHVWIGAVFFAFLIGLGVWFRGEGRWERLAIVAALVAVIRFGFYTWFEPGNDEWTLFTWVLVASVVAQASRGEARARPATRIAAGLLMALVAVCVWRSHATPTLSFREHRYERASAVVKKYWKPGYRVYGFQNRGYLAVAQRGILPHGHLPTHFDDAKPLIIKEVTRDQIPTLVLMDVMIQTGMPHHMRSLRPEWRGKVVDEPPYARVLWRSDEPHGMYVIGFLIPR